MNYAKHYNALVDRAKGRQIEGYSEKHHIIPKCMGGTDDTDNIVVLTAREHYVAHQLLMMMYPDVQGLALATRLMSTSTKFQIRNNKDFEWVRKRAAYDAGSAWRGKKRPPRTKEWSEKLSVANTGKKHTSETRAKLSAIHLGKPKSDEMKRNMSIAAKNRTPEHQAKLNAAHTGRKVSEEQKAKFRESLKLQPIVTCPHCGKSGKPRGMKCHHFDRCKEKPSGV